MYIFMFTEGIIRARFNIGSNMLVCVVSRYNYCMVYYLLVFSQECFEAAHAITYMNTGPIFAIYE